MIETCAGIILECTRKLREFTIDFANAYRNLNLGVD